MHHRIAALLFLLFCSSALFAQSINKPHLDSFFNVLAANERALGSVAIAKNGEVLYEHTIDLSGNAGNTAKPLKYRIGSITKMFTATMIFQAIEEQKLTLATPLSKYFAQFPNASKITIGMMLNHHSGLHNFISDSNYVTYHTKPISRQALLTLMAKGKPTFQPNDSAAYSNTNYVLLGFILEDLYKKPYAKLLQEKVAGKIGLSHTNWGKMPPAADEALSYSWEDRWVQDTVTDVSVPGAAGAMVATPTDLLKFIDALFKGKLVSKESLEQMKTIKDNFGMGMFGYPFGTKKFYGHTGGIDGFQALLAYNPEDSIAVAYCGNGVRFSRNDIILAVLGSYYGRPMPLPSFSPSTYVPESVTAYTGTYASTMLPIKITITAEGNELRAQATGQGQFPLTATAKDEFSFEQSGIILQFNPAAGEMTLKQGGGSFLFTKEK